ncbi:MAG: ribosome assembly RNA-binding protein YhbY [Lachnospirales bacterium]
MTSKQRAYLRKLASQIKPVVSVGKAGPAPEVIISASEALEARELIKVSVLDNCFEDVRDVANIMGERTRSEVVEVKGRKFVLYKQNRKKPVIELPR